MAGRKPLALTNLDYLAIVRHVNDLPFKRKCEAELLSILTLKNITYPH